MANMIFVSENGQKIVFDDYCDNVVEYNSYWVGMCSHCYNKYKDIIDNRVDDSGSPYGTCFVQGCNNEADYYVDFEATEVDFE